MIPHPSYHFEADLSALLGELPAESIVSRRLHRDAHVDVTLFGFAPGQVLSEHTASRAAVLQVLEGEGTFGLNGDEVEVAPGSWAAMDPHLPHTVTARTRMVMLLTMVRTPAEAAGGTAGA